jgi:hypothetical protein
MGEFKPMVKMMTTEPSVELKLKKGGSATHKRMHAEGAKMGHKPVKKMDGGMMGSMAGSSAMPMGNPVAARAMAAKRMAAKPTPPTRGMPAPTRPPMPTAAPMGRPMMRKGGGGVEAELKQHESMPASKAHKGLKTGGIAKSTKPGGYKTGGVVDGQGGYKSGGIIKTMTNKTTKVVGAKPNNNSAPTGDVKMGNGGGYKDGGMAMVEKGGKMVPSFAADGVGKMKKGGASKKHFATGGAVNNSGHAVAMPKKAPSSPVAISELSGTFKKGGRVR